MSPRPQKLNDADTFELRQEGGRVLRQLREAAGFSQREFAAEVGIPTKSFISQIETGRARIPPSEMPLWAKALRIETPAFVKMMLRYSDPLTFALLFPDAAQELEADLGGVLDVQVTDVRRPGRKPVGGREIMIEIRTLQEQVEALVGQVEKLTSQVEAQSAAELPEARRRNSS